MNKEVETPNIDVLFARVEKAERSVLQLELEVRNLRASDRRKRQILDDIRDLLCDETMNADLLVSKIDALVP